MRTFARKQNSSKKPVSSSLDRSNTGIFGQNHHKNPLLHLQRTIGNQAVQRMLRTHAEEFEVGSIRTAAPRFAHDYSRYPKTAERPQAKVTVNTPGGSSEQEADAIAEQVMRNIDPVPSPANSLPSLVGRIVQTKNESGASVSSSLSKKISFSLGSGSEMDAGTQAFMQRRFGTGFSHIRIHADAEAAHMNRELGAYAFTVGRDIYFDSGQYAPGTNPGKHLLAHELTHTLQQGRTSTSAMQKQTGKRQQSAAGLGFFNEEGRPEGAELREQDVGSESEEEGHEEAELPEPLEMQIQRSTKWAGATVHEDLNLAEMILNGGAPITWQMLNGTMLKTEANADSSINAPTISTSGSGSDWKAKVDTVQKQEGGDDETVLAPGPWSATSPKDDIGTRYGFAACTGADDSTFSALGKPSDNAIYKANRRHEDHHVIDDKVVFSQTVVWDKKLEKVKKKGATFKGANAAKAEAALWTAMGATPKEIARKYRSLSLAKGTAFHATAKGGTMKTSHAKANPDCSASSVEVRNPS